MSILCMSSLCMSFFNLLTHVWQYTILFSWPAVTNMCDSLWNNFPWNYKFQKISTRKYQVSLTYKKVPTMLHYISSFSGWATKSIVSQAKTKILWLVWIKMCFCVSYAFSQLFRVITNISRLVTSDPCKVIRLRISWNFTFEFVRFTQPEVIGVISCVVESILGSC